MTVYSTKAAFKKNTGLLAIVVVIAAVNVWPAGAIFYDNHIRTKPWIKAEIEVIRSQIGKPLIRYDTMPVADFEGIWKAWTISADHGVRLRGNDGTGHYSPSVKKNKYWTWEAFFEADIPEPKVPYRICVSYSGALNSGALGAFGPFCSETYDPEVPQ